MVKVRKGQNWGLQKPRFYWLERLFVLFIPGDLHDPTGWRVKGFGYFRKVSHKFPVIITECGERSDLRDCFWAFPV